MRVLIAGGAGFAGGSIGVYLAGRGHQVTAFDNLVREGSEHNLPRLKAAGVTVRRGDVRNREDWAAVGKFDVLIECAAQPSAIDGYANPVFDFTNNTVGAVNALEYCRRNEAGIVFFSTNKIYPQWAVHCRPIMEMRKRFSTSVPVTEKTPLDGGDRSIYGATKIAADLLIQEFADVYQIPAVVNRFSCLAGPWQWGKTEQGWVAWWVIAHRLGLPLTYIGYQGKQVRDVLYVGDLCRLIEMQIDNLRPGGQVFNVGGGIENTMSLREATELCQEITGSKVDMNTEPDARRADFCTYVSDISMVQAVYPWSPQITVEGGLQQIDRWVVDNLPLLAAMHGRGRPMEAPQSRTFLRPLRA